MKFVSWLSSLWCRAVSTVFPNSPCSVLPILHRFQPIQCLHKAAVCKFLLVGQHCHRLCEGVHWRTSFISLSLLLQQCLACLLRLIWMVLEMGGRWPYSRCFVGCCFQDLFSIARSILVQFMLIFFSKRFVSVYVIHPYSNIDTNAVWKKFRCNLIDSTTVHYGDRQFWFQFSVHWTFQKKGCSEYDTKQHRWVWIIPSFLLLWSSPRRQLVEAVRFTSIGEIALFKYLLRIIWNNIYVCKLFVLDKNSWYYITVCKIFVLHRNIWYHISRGWPKGSVFNSYYTEVLRGTTPFPGLLPFTLDPYNAEC